MFKTLIRRSLFHTKRNNYLRNDELELLKTNREKIEVLNRHTSLLLSIEELSKKTWETNQDILFANERLLQYENHKWGLGVGVASAIFLISVYKEVIGIVNSGGIEGIEKHIEDCDIINS